MNDAELAEKIFALAGRMLDADTLTPNTRALDVARKAAELARHLLFAPDDDYRAIALLFLEAEDAAEVRFQQLQGARS